MQNPPASTRRAMQFASCGFYLAVFHFLAATALWAEEPNPIKNPLDDKLAEALRYVPENMETVVVARHADLVQAPANKGRVVVETLPDGGLRRVVEAGKGEGTPPSLPREVNRAAVEFNFIWADSFQGQVIADLKGDANYSLTAAKNFRLPTTIPAGSTWEGMTLLVLKKPTARDWVKRLQTDLKLKEEGGGVLSWETRWDDVVLKQKWTMSALSPQILAIWNSDDLRRSITGPAKAIAFARESELWPKTPLASGVFGFRCKQPKLEKPGPGRTDFDVAYYFDESGTQPELVIQTLPLSDEQFSRLSAFVNEFTVKVKTRTVKVGGITQIRIPLSFDGVSGMRPVEALFLAESLVGFIGFI